MGDSRDAGRPPMSPQWAMVMARFDDVSNHLARVEGRIDANDRETRAEMGELRDQIQRTRDEVAQASLSQERQRNEGAEKISTELVALGERVHTIETTRKADVHEVLMESAPAAAAMAVRRAPRETWAGLSIQAKCGAVSAALAIVGTIVAGLVDGAPKLAAFMVRVTTAIASAG